MADISFLLLAFFLMVSDIKTDKGLLRALPPMPKENAEKADAHQRDIFTVLVNQQDNIVVCQNGVWSNKIDINTLKERVKKFLNSQRGEDPNLPELEETYIDGLGNYRVSKGIISLQCHNGTTYKKYFQVQDALTAAVNELRDELSIRKFGHPYNPDPKDKSVHKVAIDKAVPMKVSEAKPSNVNVGGTN